MPARGGRWAGFWEQRARQLQRQVQAKEERIVELETENAILHLKLAEYQEMTGKSSHAATRFCLLCDEQEGLQRGTRSSLAQLCRVIQKVKQDRKELRSSSLDLLRDCQGQQQDCGSEIVTAVQGAQRHHEAVLAWQSKAGCLEQSLRETTERYQLEKQKRKQLHNRLVELKGNIRVHCRIRPALPFDKESEDPLSQNSSVSAEVAHAVDDETVLVRWDRPGHPWINKTYNFERVYGPAESQRVVFEEVCPLLTSLLDGLISENPSRSPKVAVSVVEVYNNDIFDLLAKDSCAVTSGVKREVLTTKAGKKEIPSLTYESVHSTEEFLTLVDGRLRLRAKHATLVHADSSRSHLIITVTLTTAPSWDSPANRQSDVSVLKEPDCPSPRQPATGRRHSAAHRTSSWSPGAAPEGPTGHMEQVHAKLQLVDLAGSECAGVSGVTGAALRETSFINRSLAALADVLGALSERRGHVPYRNSKLTHLLQDVLGGDAKLLVILCVSPCRKHAAETLQSLGFGTRARQVQRGPARAGRVAPRTPR
ncbi:kinesin-like protein KIF25 isoform X8 [Equus caballus]|uniref:Kinesin-like protein n=1 Tax=Equus caballus TaxID=9796 RepID=A0A9L0S9C3_HORSE|nr:kinesin-like protein KIF25 isoform X4 [Equus caballus]